MTRLIHEYVFIAMFRDRSASDWTCNYCSSVYRYNSVHSLDEDHGLFQIVMFLEKKRKTSIGTFH